MNANKRRGGFTLIEILAATALTLLIMAVTVQLFATVTGDIAQRRATIETSDRVRATQERLARDLRWRTAPTLPPLNPRDGKGYFEITERAGLSYAGQTTFVDSLGVVDTTIADHNDLLMFTARSDGEPFVGKFGNTTAQSQVAEIAWFVRGTTLYRRVLLVAPGYAATVAGVAAPTGIINAADYVGSFYSQYDLSAHQVGGVWDPDAGSGVQRLQLNTLGDLTKPENRYAHPIVDASPGWSGMGFPHRTILWLEMGLPTLRECSDPNWPYPLMPNTVPYTTGGSQFPSPPGVAITPIFPQTGAINVDLWTDAYRTTAGANRWKSAAIDPLIDPVTGCLVGYTNGTRVAEDVILTNVIGFDIKVWDPTAPLFSTTLATGGTVAVGPGDNNYSPLLTAFIAGGAGAPVPIGTGAYVDLGYANNNAVSQFSGPGYGAASNSIANVYDTWSTHYECDGVDNDGNALIDIGTDGLDNIIPPNTVGTGGVDDPSEQEARAPYPFALRGVQIKIRVFEPDSRQVRETTVIQDFLPE